MGIAVFLIFLVCAIYVQTRGKVVYPKLTRRFSDHSNFLGPINCCFYAFSKLKNTPYIDPKEFPELDILQDNWEMIRDEAAQLHSQQAINSSDDLDDVGFNSFFKTGWKRYYLKWYGASLNSAQGSCPKTVALLEDIPSIKAAMFAMLPPGARLVSHRDPYAGSYRYHMGLDVPEDDDCYIDVDGEKYSWRNGEVVMFDETYIHYAENKTDQNRIVLFLDVKRPVTLVAVDWLNTAFSSVVLGASATKNTEGDKVGLINRSFVYLYQLRLIGKKVKAYSRPLYYGIQYAFYAYVLYMVLR